MLSFYLSADSCWSTKNQRCCNGHCNCHLSQMVQWSFKRKQMVSESTLLEMWLILNTSVWLVLSWYVAHLEMWLVLLSFQVYTLPNARHARRCLVSLRKTYQCWQRWMLQCHVQMSQVHHSPYLHHEAVRVLSLDLDLHRHRQTPLLTSRYPMSHLTGLQALWEVALS